MKKKKDFTFIIAAILFFAGLAMLGGVRYFYRQNCRLQRDLKQLNCRIKNLEADNTMQKILALRVENSLLKEELSELQRMFALVSQGKGESRKKASVSQSKTKASSAALWENKSYQGIPFTKQGNRGYIFKK